MRSVRNSSNSETALCPLNVDWLREGAKAESSMHGQFDQGSAARTATTGLEAPTASESETFLVSVGKTLELRRTHKGKAIHVRVDFHALLGSLVHFVAFSALLVLLLFAISLWVAVATGTL